MTQQDFAKEAGVDHESVIAIEEGEMPLEHAVLKSLITVLHIPMAEIVASLSTEEVSSELWLSLLEASFHSQDRQISVDILIQLLACCGENCEDLLLKLYSMIQQWTGSIELRIELLDYIISYARTLEMQNSVAKGLFYRYLVERDDFSKMEETFKSGQAVLPYVELLPRDDRVIFYYKLGVHAYNLRWFNDVITYCNKSISEDKAGSVYKGYSTLLICSSYYQLDRCDECEKYLEILRKMKYPFVQENVDFMTAKLHEKKGDTELAISLLLQCLNTCSYKMNIVNSLLEMYYFKNDSSSAHELLQREHEYLNVKYSNPISIKGHAYYFINKGKWLHRWGKNSEAVDCYIQSVSMFAELTEDDEALLRKMERTRLKMMSAAKTGRNLTDASVVQLSQELDTYIVEIQKKGILKNSLLRD
ncbi:Spo0E family sporulation regulatory protein-aspartic acid phosphatase [Paenibacillus alvei]|uniref:Spo0E family sporulation regulatory protein-aspartic acid phosphatase n=1 Tax=Paenibacillus alvei TaxID=44250 RepID=A0AAP7A0D6_PAEAL|nr:Spo0E family sporulation regulatory protein-aspartic acid phosphatase [Paenibacillus alvei]NOJ72134.1 Spo0E family sporulation regulatory protein-aspartic acid phosphatase [Paenibacillus alvei]